MYKSEENLAYSGKYHNIRQKTLNNSSTLLVAQPEGNILMLNSARHWGQGNYLQMSNKNV